MGHFHVRIGSTLRSELRSVCNIGGQLRQGNNGVYDADIASLARTGYLAAFTTRKITDDVTHDALRG